MSENIEELLNKLRMRVDGSVTAITPSKKIETPVMGESTLSNTAILGTNVHAGNTEFEFESTSKTTRQNDAIPLRTDQISSAVFVISPAQISHVSEIFANKIATVLNMRAMAPRIRGIAEQSLREALGTAKKIGKK